MPPAGRARNPGERPARLLLLPAGSVPAGTPAARLPPAGQLDALKASGALKFRNRQGIGTGSGVCFGDSGSPQFDRGTLLVLSVTSWGNGQCNANNQNYRVDTPQARAFLGQFLNLPRQ